MKKATFIKRLHKLGFSHAILNNCDDDSTSVRLSCEFMGDSISDPIVGDYYGEFQGGYPWINPKLDSLVEREGLYWEWQNPAVIVCYFNN